MLRPTIFAALLLTVIPVSAQVVGGTINGVVTDTTGAAVPGAAVVVRNVETGTERKLTSSSAGLFSAPSIAVGEYSVVVTAAGFARYSREHLMLTVGQSLNLPVRLTAGATGTVDVFEQPLTSVNTSTEQSAGLVDSKQVKELPLNGRSYDQLILLNPATVNYTAQRSGSVGTSNSSVGNMFSVSGRRPQDNLFLLNGVEYTGASLINVTPGGTSGQLLGVDAVREFNVISDSYSAAYGKRDGAQISIVTASGTNQLHGDAYEFLRNSFLDARNFFDQARIPGFQRNNFGAALGGSLRRDRLFLFGNYEGYRQNLGITDVTLVPDNHTRAGYLPEGPGGALVNVGIAPSVVSLLNLWPTGDDADELYDPASGHATGITKAYSNPTQHIREDFGTTRFDANLTANDLLFAVYTVDDSIAHTPTQNPYSLIDERLREQVLSVQEQHVFSPSLLNTARVGYSRARFLFNGSVPAAIEQTTVSFIPGKPVGAIVIAGSTASNGSSQITAAGANVGSNNAMTRNLFTFDDHVFYTLGRHQIEAGVWLQRLQSNDNLAQNQYGQASFASLTSFLQGTVKNFTYVPQPTALGWRALYADGYLEDTFQAAKGLEVRAGVRTQSSTGWNESHGRVGVYHFTNGVIATSPAVQESALDENRAKLLLEPRLAVAWNVAGEGKTSVKASMGLHHSLLDALDYRLDQAAPFNTTYTYGAGSTVLAPTAGQVSISPSTVQTDMSTPALLAYSLRIEQQVADRTVLSVGYTGSHSYHQILSADLNEPNFVICPAAACPGSLAAGTVFYPDAAKPNPALANTTSWVSWGSGNYNGLIVDLRRSLANGLQFRSNYTWAKNLDDGSAWNTSVSANTPAYVSVPQLPRLDYGPAATDIRQSAALNGSYDLPLGTGKRWFARSGAVTSHMVSGWTLSTIASLQTGFAFSPQLGYNPTNSGDSRNPVRPDVSTSFHGPLYTRGTTVQRAAQFFNANSFSAPANGAVGNVRRDTLTGPGLADWDLSLTKLTRLSDAARLQLRAEFFNVLNHTNLQTPNEVVFSSATLRSPTAGVITSAGTSRQIQLGVKLLF